MCFLKRDQVLCRLGMACMALFEFAAAVQALAQGMKLDPQNRDMAAALDRARAHASYEAACERAHVGVQRRDLVLKLRAV